jgi:hypothetical protein
LPCSIARTPAAAIGPGVAKSGSPAPSDTTSLPSTFICAARAEIARVADSAMRLERALGARPAMVEGRRRLLRAGRQ